MKLAAENCLLLDLTGISETRSIPKIDHFTVACSVTWPLNGSEAAGDLALIQNSTFAMHMHLVSIRTT